MKKTYYLYVILTAFLLVSFVFTASPAFAIFKMPAFSSREVTDGRPINSKNLRGKVLLVVFFATWCPPCREEVPGLVDLQKELAPDGFSVIAFSVDEQGPSVVASFVKRLGINYPVMMADGATALGFGGIRGIPASFLVNQKGDIVKRYIGYVPHSVLVNDIKSVMN